MSYDYLIKIIVIGDANVGKSSIIKVFEDKEWNNDSYATTIGVEFSRDTHMVSEVTNNWKDWIYQKRRHLSTSSFYKIKFKILLMIYPLSQIFFLLSLIFAFLFKLNIVFVFTVLFLKLLISYTVNYKSMRTLDVRDLYLLHPFYLFEFLDP